MKLVVLAVVLDAASMQWGQTYSGGSSQRMMARVDSDVRLAARVMLGRKECGAELAAEKE